MHRATDFDSRQTRTFDGFTLVELLVVIGIIGMLVALLLPAVMSAQEQARQTQCAKQMKDLAGAHLNHAIKKGRFAGWTAGANLQWTVQIMPYLDMQQQYREWVESVGNSGTPTAKPIDLLICPSNPAEDASAKLGYAVNAGRDDEDSNKETLPVNGIDVEPEWTAVFHDRSSTGAPAVGLEDIRDGKRQTMLLSESANLTNWDTLGEKQQGLIAELGGSNTLNDVTGSDSSAEGRPNSFHQEGFNVAYCDGSVEFFFVDQEDLDSMAQLYGNMMTPAGAANGIDATD
jgi:prepilin-type N-terminal cleavage/methylation domain-containing protein/prepilin-type processing-associated H-X9-DG protein